MAIYLCDECGQMLDDDHFPCVEHPTDSSLFCCEACADSLEEDAEFARRKAEYDREVNRLARKHNPAWDLKEKDYL